MPQREGTSPPVGRANVQRRIAEELTTDPPAPTGHIAAVVGYDHKTVAKARNRSDPADQAPPTPS